MRRPGGEHNKGWLVVKSNQTDCRLDRSQIKCTRSTGNQHKVGGLHSPAGRAIGMEWGVDDNQCGTLPFCGI